MCGRAYSTYTEEELFLRYLSGRPVKIPVLKPRYNIAPSQDVVILRQVENQKQFDLFKWGLIPFWAKDTKVGYKMINARAETVGEKPSFKNAYQKRRCIIPLSGFYEWKRDQQVKRPYCIFMKDHTIMSLAGIWERWKSPQEDQEVFSFSIITTQANSLMEKIHDRMPVILDQKDEEAWLDPKNESISELNRLLDPCPSEKIDAYEISSLVNSPKNDVPQVLKPTAAASVDTIKEE
jgi:putative SOS response-associated peptidase YedK